MSTQVQGAQNEGTPAATENPVLIAGKDENSNIRIPLVLLANGHLVVEVSDRLDTTAGPSTLGDLNAAASISTVGMGQCVFALDDSAFVGIFEFQGLVGDTWRRIDAKQSALKGYKAVWTVNGSINGDNYMVHCSGMSKCRIIITSYTSGSVSVVAIEASQADGLRNFLNRSPNVFNTVAASAAGDTAIWTPANGRKFRLQRMMISITDNATQTTSGVVTIKLRDNTTDLNLTHSVFVPASLLDTTGVLYVSPWIDLGDGILSAAANNVLNVNLSNALLTGVVRVIVAGMEE